MKKKNEKKNAVRNSTVYPGLGRCCEYLSLNNREENAVMVVYCNLQCT